MIYDDFDENYLKIVGELARTMSVREAMEFWSKRRMSLGGVTPARVQEKRDIRAQRNLLLLLESMPARR